MMAKQHSPKYVAIAKRDGYACRYCGCALTFATATFDHVIPKSQGGDSGVDNLVMACSRCNTLKGGRTPEQANMVLKEIRGYNDKSAGRSEGIDQEQRKERRERGVDPR